MFVSLAGCMARQFCQFPVANARPIADKSPSDAATFCPNSEVERPRAKGRHMTRSSVSDSANASAPQMSPATTPRLFVTDDLQATVQLDVDGARAHYLRNVLRLGPDAVLRLFNGRDGEWSARIVRSSKGRVVLVAEAQLRPQAAEPDLWLVFAPIKRGAIDTVAEKATELGAALLQPVVTQRTVVDRVNAERLQSIAVEAAEQSERLTVPAVRTSVSLEKLLREWLPRRRLLLCAEAGGARPVADVLGEYARDTSARAEPWAIMIGPEGGFARSELDALRKLPFVIPVGLGPRILRADTAALAALACWQAILGDGQQRPPHRSSA
jgi:16S rRNA (uracil1498-N3)-methyltransferase